MATNDTISDMLTRIRNATLAKHQTTAIPATRMTLSIARVMKQEGFIADFEETGENIDRRLVVSLKYEGKNRQSIIKRLKRVSKPGLRVYSNSK